MRGKILIGVLVLSISLLKANSFRCYIIDSTYKHSLQITYSKKAEQFKLPMEFASSKYVELKGVHIEVRTKRINTMMAARPKLIFLFNKKKKRKYVIYITDNPKMNAGPIFEGMSECAIAGVLGHELAHIVDYQRKSKIQLLWLGLSYFFNRDKTEAKADLIACKHGFGDNLLEYTKYINESPYTNRKYLRMKNKHYYSVAEMKHLILNLF